MKIYISADIEGITGTTDWDETEQGKVDFKDFRKQMTAEVAAACRGAIRAGATEIWVKDAHGFGRSLIASELPPEVKLMRGWSGHPYSMMQGIDKTFEAAMMIGYHSRAGMDLNPLAHTITGGLTYIKINGEYASEFLLNSYTAELNNVPVVFLSGDKGICEEASGMNPSISKLSVKEGKGNLTVNMHPELAVSKIQEMAEMALQSDLSTCRIQLPDTFNIEIRYQHHERAYRASFYPGAGLVDPFAIQFESGHYFEILRMLSFTLR